jgi:WXG100 family type VII secretion target
MRYRVELEELSAFIEALEAFEQRAEAVASRVDSQISALHANWSGDAAAAHRGRHDEWVATAGEMREALAELREVARKAHHNYSGTIEVNMAMWP